MAATHEFVSRAEILEYRTVTTLLQYTDVAKSNPDSDRSGYRTPKPEQGIWERLNHFVNLLVREHKVVAILASGGLKSLSADVALIQQTPHLGGGQGEHNDDDDDNNWLGTLSPHRDQAPNTRSSGEFPKVNVQFLPGSAAVLEGDAKCYPVFCRNQSLSFEDHCSVVLQLLKNNQAALDTNAKSRTALDFRTWILLSSCKKMRSRFKAGEAKRNLWRYLVEINDEDLTTEEPESDDLLSETLSEILPTDGQKVVIRRLSKFGFLDEAANEQPFFDKEGRRRFRQALSQSLRQAEKNVVELCKVLASKGFKDMNTREPSVQESNSVSFNAGRDALGKVMRSVELLWLLRKECPQQLEATLRWIAAIFKMRRTTLDMSLVHAKAGPGIPSSSETSSSNKGQSSSVKLPSSSPIKQSQPEPPAKSPSPTMPSAQEDILEREEAKDQLSQLPIFHQAQVAAEQTDLTRELEAQKTLQGLILEDQEQVNDENLEMEEIAMDPKRGWAHAANRYIQLICTPFAAMDSLLSWDASASRDTAYSSYVKRASVRVVGLEPKNRDEDMQSFESLLKELVTDEVGYSLIERWIKGLDMTPKGKNWDQPKFRGNWHCETILLSIHALSLSIDPAGGTFSSRTSLRDALENIADISEEVIETLKNRGQILSVSKRCCPACNKLAELIRDERFSQPSTQQQKLAYPGYHVTWFPVALPPWLPKRFGIRLLDHAKGLLSTRMSRILDLLEQDRNVPKRSASYASAGPEPEPGSPSKRSKIDRVALDQAEDEEFDEYLYGN